VKKTKPKSVILLSGGLDSTVSAAVAARKTKVLFALTFVYGQRAARMEIQASRRICQALKIKSKVVKLPFFKEFKKCSLISHFHSPFSSSLSSLWVPNRNGLFINIAACYTEYYGADLIVTGFNAEEARRFPDNSRQFIRLMNQTLTYGTLKKIKVISYVANLVKKEIYSLGLRNQAPLEHVYSCYLGGKKMCGKCASCRKLYKAIRDNAPDRRVNSSTT
jgi:7-cyano-7-deazaguanine synthase